MSNGSQFISLFEEHRPVRRGVSSVFFSAVFHGLGAGLLSFGLLHLPRIREPLLSERYSIRHLDLHSSEVPDKANPKDGYYPKADRHAKKDSKSSDPSQEPILPELPDAVEAKQTLVQPDVHTHVALSEEAPIPTVMVWTPEIESAKQIVPPPPQKPVSVDSKPSIDLPNEEINAGEIPLMAAQELPKIPTPPAGSSSPIAAQADSTLHLAPSTASNSSDQPTPAAVLTVSDLQMTDGTIVLPPVNQTHSASGSSGLDHGTSGDGRSGSVAPGADDGSNKDKLAEGGMTTQHIALPRDGKFGVIVVGTSLAEEYPQTLQIWSDRVAYTAYLHVGLSKNWILQYSQLRSTEAAANGNVARLEAPWPYDILRPNLVPADLNADALMVHGILNEAGQLVSLAVAFPQQFAQSAFVLQALEKWQFRPALQQGKPTAVEVLLIIPDELD